MAKRFADTKLTREAWYRRMPPLFKAAWRYLTDECDEVGVWSIDQASMDFHVGAAVDLTAFLNSVNVEKSRVIVHGEKLVIVGFVDFQYGPLTENTTCKPHLKYIQLLKKHSLWIPYVKGFQTLKEEEKEKEEEMEKETETEKAPPIQRLAAPLPMNVARADVEACLAEYVATMTHFGITRTTGDRERIEIGRAIMRHGANTVQLAFVGARKQVKTKNFDPAQFVSLTTYLHPHRIERYANLGSGKESAEGIDWSKIWGER